MGQEGGLQRTGSGHCWWPSSRNSLQIIQAEPMEEGPVVQGELEAESGVLRDGAGAPDFGLQGPFLVAWYPWVGGCEHQSHAEHH